VCSWRKAVAIESQVDPNETFKATGNSGFAPNAERCCVETSTMSNSQEVAILAGGCFWGIQHLLRRYPGVLSTRTGYTGGDAQNATYRKHGTHAEAIEIVFDFKLISFRKLLEYFFQIHDPTALNRQGNDIGTSYRSAIFYTSEDQKQVTEDIIADIDAPRTLARQSCD
jgi:methionine-S-sulfoxide reductase